MKLYHFTPAHLVDSILKEGLIKGLLPIIALDGTVSFVSPCQWLTDDGDWDAQSWATRNVVRYDRTECRLLIKIPKSHRHSLCWANEIPYLPEPSRRLITDWPGSEHWYVYFGKIPSGWIRRLERRSREGKQCSRK